MAKPKPIIIDGEYTTVPSNSKLVDVVSPTATSVLTDSGKLIHRSEFASTPIPDGFEQNLSAVNKGC